jgi:hypothetical protein
MFPDGERRRRRRTHDAQVEPLLDTQRATQHALILVEQQRVSRLVHFHTAEQSVELRTRPERSRKEIGGSRNADEARLEVLPRRAARRRKARRPASRSLALPSSLGGVRLKTSFERSGVVSGTKRPDVPLPPTRSRARSNFTLRSSSAGIAQVLASAACGERSAFRTPSAQRARAVSASKSAGSARAKSVRRAAMAASKTVRRDGCYRAIAASQKL